MATVFLHVGQCGNQLGQVFWEEVSNSKWSDSLKNDARQRYSKPSSKLSTVSSRSTTSSSSSPSSLLAAASSGSIPFSLVDGSLPCVLVDTEPKVVRRCLDRVNGSDILARRVPSERSISGRTGRGNNWAFGYHGRKGGASGCDQDLLTRVLDSVRKLVEKCDRFCGFVMFHSIAGGTGSGLGSALLENLRSEYPLTYIISVAIAPFSQGETPLQHFNSLLCFSWLQAYSDSILFFGNDLALEQAHKYPVQPASASVLPGGRKGERADRDTVTVHDMNRHISSAVCNTFMPIWQLKQKLPNIAFQEPWELIRSLCPDPRTKFITSNHVHLSKPGQAWGDATTCILHHGSSGQWRKAERRVKAQTSSLVFVARGSPSNMSSFNIAPLEAKLKKAYNTVQWNPFPVDFWLSHEPFMKENKLVTILANSSVILDHVKLVQERASVMFREKAYLHWYERYGCESDTFKQAFESVQRIIDNYNDI